MHIRYAEYFAGIGAPGKGIHKVTARHGDTAEFVYGFEIDKYARNAFAAIHGVDEDKIIHDITDQPDTLPEVDIVFWSPPCTDYSIAGMKLGREGKKGNLFWNGLEAIKKSNPKFCIMENVANLANQFKDDFEQMLIDLEKAGYVNMNKVLNSKHYGIPQNRERIFVVSIRKDIYDSGHRFEWPNEIPLKLRLKDMLEDDVDDKYYLSENAVKRLINDGEGYHSSLSGDIARTLMASDYKICRGMNLIGVEQIGNISESNSFNGNPQTGRVYSDEGLAPTLSTMQGGGQEPKILVKSATVGGHEEAHPGDSINLEHPNSKTRRGRVGSGVAQTLTTSCNQGYYDGYKIRKLTPLECFRLQGFDDEDYYKAVEAYDKTWKVGASDSQMYKRAGNSITVDVEVELIEQLVYERKQLGAQLTFF